MTTRSAALIFVRLTRIFNFRTIKQTNKTRLPESNGVRTTKNISKIYQNDSLPNGNIREPLSTLLVCRNVLDQIKRRTFSAAPNVFPLTSSLVAFSFLTTKDKSDEVFNKIGQLLQKTFKVEQKNDQNSKTVGRNSLKDFELGRLLGYGCNAAVYEARLRTIDDQYSSTSMPFGSFAKIDEQTDSDNEILSHQSSDSSSSSFEQETNNHLNDLTLKEVRHRAARNLNLNRSNILPPGQFNLAIKMLFNYGIQSNSEALEKAMDKEVLPLRKCGFHPNIVRMYSCFVDDFPLLKEASEYYPMAIPTSLSPEGYGRNKTLFIVMRRYDVTLPEYLRLNQSSQNERLILFAQLIEALLYLKKNFIVHRDLKSDNLLISSATGELVLADFGCALQQDRRLRVPYVTDEISKGGNLALMAPEIVTCQPGPKSFLDYSKSDLWASGTLAYEFFSLENPFFHGNYRQQTYDDQQLPSLTPGAPVLFEQLIFSFLRKNPKERPSILLAADCVQLYLWLKSKVVNMDKNELYQNYMWTALDSFFHKTRLSLVELNLKKLFFERQCSQSLYNAQNFLQRLSTNI